MEEELEKPKVIEDPKIKKIKRIKGFLLILLAIIIVSTVITGIYYLLGQEISLNQILTIPRNSLSSPTPTSVMLETKLVLGKLQNTPILKVGSETLYQADIINFLSIYYPKQLSETNISQEIVNKAYDSLTNDSILLQEGVRQNLINIDSSVFNNAQKNYQKRNSLIQNVTEKIKAKDITSISGEILSMWFNNPAYPEPSIGVERAKQIVYTKMMVIYKELIAGKLTFDQAAKRIEDDSQQESIDPSYKSNAYALFDKKSKQAKIFTDQQSTDIVWSLNKNQISEVILIKSYRDKPTNIIEAEYVIIKITDKVDSAFSNFEQWLEATKKIYAITKLL